jgi:hypothetical protein
MTEDRLEIVLHKKNSTNTTNNVRIKNIYNMHAYF